MWKKFDSWPGNVREYVWIMTKLETRIDDRQGILIARSATTKALFHNILLISLLLVRIESRIWWNRGVNGENAWDAIRSKPRARTVYSSMKLIWAVIRDKGQPVLQSNGNTCLGVIRRARDLEELFVAGLNIDSVTTYEAVRVAMWTWLISKHSKEPNVKTGSCTCSSISPPTT